MTGLNVIEGILDMGFGIWWVKNTLLREQTLMDEISNFCQVRTADNTVIF